MATIQRISLREQVLQEVRNQILQGELKSGWRIREESLAREIGVSRTPVREALHSLEREGLVTRKPGKGFSVATLSAAEAQELYPLRALLEPLALRLAGIPDRQHLDELRKLNGQLASTPKGADWIDTDDRWHDQLLRGCPNRHLLRMIDQLRRLTRRYEFAYFAGYTGSPSTSTTQHDEILANLESSDLDRACDLLADNMVIGIEPILRWLRETQSS
jgi:DNA-binding GntR family transcriptional regulator